MKKQTKTKTKRTTKRQPTKRQPVDKKIRDAAIINLTSILVFIAFCGIASLCFRDINTALNKKTQKQSTIASSTEKDVVREITPDEASSFLDEMNKNFKEKEKWIKKQKGFVKQATDEILPKDVQAINIADTNITIEPVDCSFSDDLNWIPFVKVFINEKDPCYGVYSASHFDNVGRLTLKLLGVNTRKITDEKTGYNYIQVYEEYDKKANKKTVYNDQAFKLLRRANSLCEQTILGIVEAKEFQENNKWCYGYNVYTVEDSDYYQVAYFGNDTIPEEPEQETYALEDLMGNLDDKKETEKIPEIVISQPTTVKETTPEETYDNLEALGLIPNLNGDNDGRPKANMIAPEEITEPKPQPKKSKTTTTD